MAAYVVLFRESPVRNPAEMEKYREKSAKHDASKYGLKPLVVYGKQIPLEGTPPDAVIVLEFPSIDAAKQWYYSDVYQDAVKHRLAAADYRGVIVEGFAP
jgi:uncharacterized protein (DUF1330 family)